MAIELTTINSGYNLSAINTNFQRLEDALNDSLLWRNGTTAGETLMFRDIDMNGHTLLNLAANPNDPGSILTIALADERYYNITGDVLQGDLDAGGYRLKNLGNAVAPNDAVRKEALDNEEVARQGADANLQEQMTGNIPLEASAFSQISWHSQDIPNSVTVPDDKNAWSFGPQMEISQGQLVTVGSNSFWTIASGRVVEADDLHSLIADRLTTTDETTVVQVSEIATDADVTGLQGQITSLAGRMSAEETKVQSIPLGGTGASTAPAARTNLGAAASGANTDITSIIGSAATLTTARTVQTNLASTSTASFNGSANIAPGVTGVLGVANGGTGNTTNQAATSVALATSRTFQTNLASTTATSFNGTANVTPGVTGILPRANGGTGQSDVAYLRAEDSTGVSIANTGFTLLAPTVVTDTKTAYSAGAYTIPSAGYYHIRGEMRIGAAASATAFAMLSVTIDDAAPAATVLGRSVRSNMNTANEIIIEVNCIMSLNAAQVVRLFASQNNTSAVTAVSKALQIIRVA